MSYRGLVLCWLFLALPAAAITPEEHEKWKQIAAGYNANLAIVRTLHVEYSARLALGPDGQVNRYTVIHDRDGKKWRQDCQFVALRDKDKGNISPLPDIRKFDRLVTTDGSRTFVRDRQAKRLIISDSADRRMPSMPEPAEMLPRGSVATYEAMMAQEKLELVSVSTGKEGEQNVINVEFRVPETGYRGVSSYAPQQGYLPMRCREYGPDGTLTGEQLITAVHHDKAAGCFYPVAGVDKVYRKGKEVGVTEMNVDVAKLRINQPTNAVTFALEPDPGETIWDVDHMRELKVMPPPATRPTTHP